MALACLGKHLDQFVGALDELAAGVALQLVLNKHQDRAELLCLVGKLVFALHQRLQAGAHLEFRAQAGEMGSGLGAATELQQEQDRTWWSRAARASL